ncbi:Imm9 family immunity protein [Fibrella sp. WM1]|uniref:Imm9 family immunity protein n=1 Tax=Fibrella musci TaxID=3242485 RepID=UPI003520D6BC
MKVSLSQSSYVINLFDLINIEVISGLLEGLLIKVSAAIHNDKLSDWQLVFNLIYNGDITEVRVFKRTKSYTSVKEKWITIHIPIPTDQVIFWGVEKSKIVRLGISDKRYYVALNNDFLQSNSLEEHCYKSAKAGIFYTIMSGLTVSGQSIQVEKDFQA